MYVQPRFSLLRAVAWTWEVIPTMALWSGGLVAAHLWLELEWVQLPGLPVGVLGTAVAFYLGFKGSAAYERLWEARKIWGGIVNTSRTWGVFVKTLVSDLHLEGAPATPLAEVHQELIYRHLAWVGALRLQLRRPKPWEHREPWNDKYRELFGTLDTSDARIRRDIEAFLSADELDTLMSHKNRATQLVRRQGERLKDLFADGRIEDFRHMELIRLLEELYTLQGKAERIKNFPLPRQYASANHWFVKIFLLMLPLSLISAFHVGGLAEIYVWGVVPVSVLVGWVFYSWDAVLEYSENPFEGLVNDIPMDALSRTIEIDLREMLGETELPAPIMALQDQTLM